MNESQAVGSGISYARRYALAAIFAIAQEDDDAQYNRQTAAANSNNAVQTRKNTNLIVKGYMNSDWSEAKLVIDTLTDEEKKNVWVILDAAVKTWIKNCASEEQSENLATKMK